MPKRSVQGPDFPNIYLQPGHASIGLQPSKLTNLNMKNKLPIDWN
jgi:hypothetical protein